MRLLSADALCVVSLVVSCSRSPLFHSSNTEPVIPIHYDTAHSTAHVDDTLGGSALSGINAGLNWEGAISHATKRGIQQTSVTREGTS